LKEARVGEPYAFELDVVSASAERAEHAAALRVDRKIPTRTRSGLISPWTSPEHILVTADYDFKAVPTWRGSSSFR